MDTLRALAKASGETLKLGGIIDGDWRGTSEKNELKEQGLLVLAVHEIENLLLHPPTVEHVIARISGDPSIYQATLLAAADKRAGTWIFDAARTDKHFEAFPPPDAAVRELAHRLTWADFQDIPARAEEIANADPQLEPDQRDLLRKHLEVRAKVYARVREDGQLWKSCEGKEVFRSIVGQIGFADAETAERAIIGAWSENPDLVPAELKQLRTYVDRLQKGDAS
jgi:hypothetical protein